MLFFSWEGHSLKVYWNCTSVEGQQKELTQFWKGAPLPSLTGTERKSQRLPPLEIIRIIINLANFCGYPQADGITPHMFIHSLAQDKGAQAADLSLCVRHGSLGRRAVPREALLLSVSSDASLCPAVAQRSWYWYLLVPVVELGCWVYSAQSLECGVAALQWLGFLRHSIHRAGHLYHSWSSHVCQYCPKPRCSSEERFF